MERVVVDWVVLALVVVEVVAVDVEVGLDLILGVRKLFVSDILLVLMGVVAVVE